MQIFSAKTIGRLIRRTPVTWTLIILMWVLAGLNLTVPSLAGLTQTFGLTGRTFGAVFVLSLMALVFVLALSLIHI